VTNRIVHKSERIGRKNDSKFASFFKWWDEETRHCQERPNCGKHTGKKLLSERVQRFLSWDSRGNS
jgi:hypothetical protein